MKLVEKIIILIAIVLTSACSLNRYSPKINYVLDASKSNKRELKKAIDYFQNKGDSLQLEAVLFLIENMPEHSFTNVVPCDSTDNEIDWNISDFENYKVARSSMDSLKEKHGFGWKLKTKNYDHQTITADFLIHNVEDAFYVWHNFPWAKDYSFDVFKEFILPYRGSNEPIPTSNFWRQDFMDRYQKMLKEMTDTTDPLQAAAIINKELRSWFKFNEIYYLHPTDQSVDEMQTSLKGRCEDMTNLAIAAMRANGIAVTSDYTPHWADSGNNHAWNAIITHNEKAVPFMGCESDPGSYSIRSRVAKVYRKTFAKQTGNLASFLEEDAKAPAWLKSENYIDVTTKYTKNADISIAVNGVNSDSVHVAYLAVFNSGEWRAIQWSKLENASATFLGMGLDLCYLPMILSVNELIPVGDPFILQRDGTIRFIRGNRSLQDLTLLSTTKKKIANATEEKQIAHLQKSCEYELFYWQDKWQLAGKQVATSQPMIFQDVPADRLYWLVQTNSGREERIFTYEKEKQVWW